MSKQITPRPRRYSKLTGLGVYRPEIVIDNAEVCTWIESSDEWIRERSGIVERRFAPAEVGIVEMSVEAAKLAIADAGLTAADIDNVIVATLSHYYQTPSAAALVAAALGLRKPGAIDVNAACAGFTYAIGLADGAISTGNSEHTLVIGVEKLSDWVDRHDRGTSFLFADGAGAVVVSASDTAEIGPTVWGSDGDSWDAIVCLPSWLDLRGPDRNHAEGEFPALRMQGQKVFRWAVGDMPAVAQAALDAAGITTADLDLFVPHQANMRITDAMLRSLQLPDTVAVARDIEFSGNTSAASIPLALDRLRQDGVAKSGDLALLIGFGAGLAFAAQVVRVP